MQKLFSSSLPSKDKRIKIYTSIILPVVLCGCETWSHRLRVLGNRVSRKILGPKRGETTGEHKEEHKEEHKDLYSSKNIIRLNKRNEMGRACNMYGVEER